MSIKVKMVANSFYIPKGNPDRPRGEDAHFFCRKEQVIGVADGVGGWFRDGIDSGEYARELMKNAADFVNESLPAAADPKTVLSEAFAKTAKPGSSTACIISLAGNGLLAANVGDSGFAVIRGGRTIYRSRVMQCAFNCPYQLGLESPGDLKRAEKMAVEVEIGDVVVAGTDGLFDNIFLKEIEAIVEQCYRKGKSPETVARELAAVARRKSLDGWTDGPFAVAACKAGVVWCGGKRDDITVVVAYVIPFDKFALD